MGSLRKRFSGYTALLFPQILLALFFTFSIWRSAVGGQHAPHSPPHIPSLSLQVHYGISAAIGKDQETFFARRNHLGYSFLNQHQEFTATVSRDGLLFTTTDKKSTGLMLTKIGYHGNLQEVSDGRLVHMANRVEHQRGDYTEWYRNGPMGLQHGVTIHSSLPKKSTTPADLLKLVFALPEEAKTHVSQDGRSAVLYSPQGQRLTNYTGLLVIDANGKELPAYLSSSENFLTINVDDSEGVYPITVDPLLTPDQMLKPNLELNDLSNFFGSAVAAHGDTIAVSVLVDSQTPGTCEAVVYVFQKPEGGWNEELTPVRLRAKEPKDNGFGRLLAMGHNIIAVGAPTATGTSFDGKYNGVVYVYERNGETWTDMTETRIIRYPEPREVNRFGTSLAVGQIPIVTTFFREAVVVGVDDTNYKPDRGGSVYVFRTALGQWEGDPKIIHTEMWAPSSVKGDRFGAAVAMNEKGVVAVGAPYAGDESEAPLFTLADNGGRVFVFNSVFVNESVMLAAGDRERFDWLGSSLSFSGDVLVAGAPENFKPVPIGFRGSAYIFEKQGKEWEPMEHTAKLSDPEGKIPYFGNRVALNGEKLIIAGGGSAAALFSRPASGWMDSDQFSLLLPSTPQPTELFGFSAALGDDFAIFGAPARVNSSEESGLGAALLFDNLQESTEAINETVTLSDPLEESHALLYQNDQFGTVVDIGKDTAVVASLRHGLDCSGARRGAVYVFNSNDGSWTNLQEFNRLKPREGINYGFSVSLDDNQLAVSSVGLFLNSDPEDPSYYTSEGYVDIYERKDSSSPFVLVRTVNHPYGVLTRRKHKAGLFGASIALHENLLVVGAPDSGSEIIDGDGYVNSDSKGKAYLFERKGKSWTEDPKLYELLATDVAEFDRVGNVVAVHKNTVVVGAKDKKVGSERAAGAVYVYEKPDSGWTNITTSATLRASDAEMLDRFGQSVAIYKDIIAVGAPESNNRGAVYVFKRPKKGWAPRFDLGETIRTETAKLTAEDGSVSNKFGGSVDIYDSVIVAGARFHKDAGGSHGAVYIFKKPGDAWQDMTHTEKFNVESGNDFIRFGTSVAIYGNHVVGGAPYADLTPGSNFNEGVAYVFNTKKFAWELFYPAMRKK